MLNELLDAKKYTGRAEEQTEKFIANEIDPILSGEAAMNNMGEIKI